MLTQEQNEYVTRTQEKPFTEAAAEALSPKAGAAHVSV